MVMSRISREYLRTISAWFERFMFGALVSCPLLQVHRMGQATPDWMAHRGVQVLLEQVN